MPLDPTKIRERREALKLSQREAANRAGMPRPNWARIESGKRLDPKISTVVKIASALNCPLASIIA
jgi:transcriptional regulator with XRE-family HTH domain